MFFLEPKSPTPKPGACLNLTLEPLAVQRLSAFSRVLHFLTTGPPSSQVAQFLPTVSLPKLAYDIRWVPPLLVWEVCRCTFSLAFWFSLVWGGVSWQKPDMDLEYLHPSLATLGEFLLGSTDCPASPRGILLSLPSSPQLWAYRHTSPHLTFYLGPGGFSSGPNACNSQYLQHLLPSSWEQVLGYCLMM